MSEILRLLEDKIGNMKANSPIIENLVSPYNNSAIG
jgi:hypothetical protein